MTVPFMRAYTELLVQDLPQTRRACDRRHGGVHPDRRDPEVNEVALAKVREDKEREADDGFDGTWVAHPDLVPVATGCSTRCSATGRIRWSRCATTSPSTPAQLLDFDDPRRAITDAGLRLNVSVGVRYLDAWLRGAGAAAIDNLMEDAATAEISRAQIWQWMRHGRFDGRAPARSRRRSRPRARRGGLRRRRAGRAEEFLEFLTRAYELPKMSRWTSPRARKRTTSR